MTGSPPTDNSALETFDSIAAEAVLKVVLPVAEKATETYAEAQVPFLASPVIKQVFEFGVEKLEEHEAIQLLTLLVQVGVKIIVTIQTDEEKANYSKAEAATRAALLSRDPAQIAAAKKEMDDAAASIIHTDGWLQSHQ